MIKSICHPVEEPAQMLQNFIIMVNATEQNKGVSNIKSNIIWRYTEIQIYSTHNSTCNSCKITLLNIIILVLRYKT